MNKQELIKHLETQSEKNRISKNHEKESYLRGIYAGYESAFRLTANWIKEIKENDK